MKNWYTLETLSDNRVNHYSVNGEDGELDYIFKHIEPRSKFAVEFGASRVEPSGHPMILWMIEKYGWKSLFFEWRKGKAQINAKKYNVRKALVTPKNINRLFKKYKVPVDVDLVVIDVDGQDYWIWQALSYRPSIVMIEFNQGLPARPAVVMRRDDKHYKWRNTRSIYYGASLLALKNLGIEKGYVLIDKISNNLVFCRNDLIDVDYDVSVDLLHPRQNPEKISESYGGGVRRYGFVDDEKWIEV